MTEHNRPTTLIKWLRMADPPQFANAPWFGGLIGSVVAALGILLSIAAIALVIGFMQASFALLPFTDYKTGEAVRNIGVVLVALFGAPFLIWRTIVAARQVQIADEALFNDKINAAAHDLAAQREVTRIGEQDGNEIILSEIEDDLVARAAAIDRLEGLVAERPDMAPRIDRLLATYVRGTFPHIGLRETELPFDRKSPRMDLQRAIDTIGRIHQRATNVDTTHWRLDLKGCDLVDWPIQKSPIGDSAGGRCVRVCPHAHRNILHRFPIRSQAA